MSSDQGLEYRREMLAQYRGFVFRWQAYKTESSEWDHDHCAGCWASFSEHPEEWDEAVLTEGFVTLWPTEDGQDKESEFLSEAKAAGYRVVHSPSSAGFQLHWICAECFEAVRRELAFAVDAEHPQWHKAGM